MEANQNIKLKSIAIAKSKPVPSMKDWRAYTLEMSVEYRNRDIDVNEIVFSNGTLITSELYHMDRKTSIKDDFTSSINEASYNKEHLLAGNINASHKLVVFSDPLCPYCQRFIPELIEFTNANKKDVALFYYGFPLVSIHPSAEKITKVALAAKQKKLLSFEQVKSKIYKAKLPTNLTDDKAIERTNDILGLKGDKRIKESDFDAKVNETYLGDLKLGKSLLVSGTPTLFVNGKKDSNRVLYKNIRK